MGGLDQQNGRRYVGHGPDCEDGQLLLHRALLLVRRVDPLQLVDDRDACVGLHLLVDVIVFECARVGPGLEELTRAQVHFAPRDWEAPSLVWRLPLDVDGVVLHDQVTQRSVGRGTRAISKHAGHADDVEEMGQVEHRQQRKAVVLVRTAVDEVAVFPIHHAVGVDPELALDQRARLVAGVLLGHLRSRTVSQG
eukprot:scaffold12402_cov71-Phaeocystis_antarctica.AAC.5